MIGAVAFWPGIAMASHNATYSQADQLRAQLALMGDRPDGCPPWCVITTCYRHKHNSFANIHLASTVSSQLTHVLNTPAVMSSMENAPVLRDLAVTTVSSHVRPLSIISIYTEHRLIFLLVCGSLPKGKDRPMRSGSTCECDEGWTGINCNVCTDNKACNALMDKGEGGVCYQNGEVVNHNYQICDVTNQKITSLLGKQRPEVTFTCKREDQTCDFQCQFRTSPRSL